MSYTASITKRKEGKKMTTLIVCLVVFLIILGGAIGAEGILVVCGIVLVLITFFGIKWRIEGKQEEKERNARLTAEQKKRNLRKFYQICQKAGITKIETENDLQKATQIANSMQLGDIDVKAFFWEAMSLIHREKREEEAIKRRKQETALEKIRISERAKCAELEKYSTLFGREKRLAILHDKYNTAFNNAPLTQEQLCRPIAYARQSDWAIHGGIASGIAGPAAGLSVAMDVQRQNAEECARAETLNSAYISALARSGAWERAADEEKKHEASLSSLRRRISKAETAMIGTLSAEECFNLLEFSDATVTVTKTGTCKIAAKCGLKEELYILDNVKATIDGTVLAKIFDNGMTVGTAKLVFPLRGIPSVTPVALKGMCLFCGRPDRKYSIQFESMNLWAMEQ